MELPETVRASELARRLGARHHGPDTAARRLLAPEDAAGDAEALTVAFDASALGRILASPPAVVVSSAEPPGTPPCAVLVVADARLALARLSAWFDRRPPPASGLHPAAVVDPTAELEPGVSVGAGAVVGPGARVGAGSVIGPLCSLGGGSRVGRGSVLHAGVRLYDGVAVGDRVVLHAGVVLGADGFGYAAGPGGAEKIHHLGTVVIEDDVEIGAGTCVDRGTLSPTRIGARSKIDNLCQIGHNVVVGSDCLIAGMAGIGGSARLGRGVTLGGYVAVADHVTIHDGATVAGRSGVTKDVPAGETWAGFPAQPYRRWVRSLYLLGRLETLWQAFRGGEGGGPR